MNIYLLIPTSRVTGLPQPDAITAYEKHAEALSQKEAYELDNVINRVATFEIVEVFLIGHKS